MAYPGHPGAGGGYHPVKYGGTPRGPAFPRQIQDLLFGYFAAVAGQDGQIDADELQRCLTQSDIAGGYKPFNLEKKRQTRPILNLRNRNIFQESLTDKK
uniref:EF-hand domain-containing protein n=1 Tax=Macaca nemestrina TaxID=9545 RepID=A0A2K6DFH3_MACNE